MIRIAVFASGSGTNAENLIRYFNDANDAGVVLVMTNKAGAGVVGRAEALGVPVRVFNPAELMDNEGVRGILSGLGIDYIVLAGFLLKIPSILIREWNGRIINIHPALLPKYGGKGMYGQHVHRAVIDAGERESGISIHLVNENYDEGSVLFQARCPVRADDTPESLAERIHELEYRYFPEVVKEQIDKIQRLREK